MSTNKPNKSNGPIINKQDYLKVPIGFLVIIITMFHYLTPTRLYYMHEVYKVSYFIPIILAAFAYGFKGGIGTSIIVTLLYFPHIMIQWGGPILMNLSRFLMILLYNLTGGLTGYLWEKERTERQRYQQTAEQLAEALRKLQETSEEMVTIENQLRRSERLSTLGELTASLAHEVRNPLASIRGVAEILRDESSEENHKKFVDILLKETQRLDSVVANYLSLARQQSPSKENADIGKIIGSTLSLLGPELRKRQIQANVTISPPNLRLFCNESQIRQALLNVLLNAVQASPAQGILTIKAEKNQRTVLMTVQDQGPGFSRENLSHIFEPFYTEKAEGTGLGLAISKRIIESHGGRIVAENSKAGGAIIKMEIPII